MKEREIMEYGQTEWWGVTDLNKADEREKLRETKGEMRKGK